MPTYDTDRVLTVPNVVSVLRLLGVPLFLWLVLVRNADIAAVVVLAVAGATDWVDGFLARRLHQISRVGQMLDPVADRLYILAIIIGLAGRDLIPWTLVVVLVLRDVLLALIVFPALRTRGYSSLPVHFIGKAATFNLLFAFPLVLLGGGESAAAMFFRVFGWAGAIWGTALYWWAGLLYGLQTRRLLRTHQRVAPKAVAD